MNEGWIKMHRKISEWEWYQDANTMRVFLHLLISVNSSEKSWRGVRILPGQVLTGRKTLSDQLNISEQGIRTALKHLQLTNEVTIKSTKEYSIIELRNWKTYQLSNQRINQPLTNDQPTSNQPLTTTKESKESKESKENNSKVFQKLEKWLSGFDGVQYPKGYAQKLMDEYGEKVVARALKDSAVTSISKFSEIADYHKKKKSHV